MNSIGKGLSAALIGAGMLMTSVGTGYADVTSDAILQVLVDKGVISDQEIGQIKQKIKNADEERGIEGNVVKEEKAVPNWVKSTKFKGDLRLRNEIITENPKSTANLSRQRIRLRFGFETQVHEKVDVGFGLATGSSADHTSTNQTLDNAFDKKAIWVDYAFATLRPLDGLSLTGGKFKNPFFRTDMLWDSDLQLEGAYGNYKTTFDLSDMASEFYVTGGAFPIEQVAYNTNNAKSITLYAGQAGLNFKLDGMKIKTGVAYYNFHGLKNNGQAISHARGTNTAYTKDLNVTVPTINIDFKDVVGKVDLGLVGEFASSNGPAVSNNAYRYGVWIGDHKVKNEGDWKIVGQYSKLERDAFIDSFPDSDFISGRTNAKGWEFIGDYALFKNVILSADYYNTKEITTGLTHQVIQTDFIVKF